MAVQGPFPFYPGPGGLPDPQPGMPGTTQTFNPPGGGLSQVPGHMNTMPIGPRNPQKPLHPGLATAPGAMHIMHNMNGRRLGGPSKA